MCPHDSPRSLLRRLIDSQRWLSRHFDRLLPRDFRIDGNQDFVRSMAPPYLRSNSTLYDIGGGKHPYLGVEDKHCLNIRVVGLDIDRDELNRAPDGAYDETVCADIAVYRGCQDADVVICQALLEHVRDVAAAFTAIAGILKPGGTALIFVPSRNAMFARLNILLPQKTKQAILYTISPDTRRDRGFPSYYDRCTPSQFKALAARNGLSVAEERYYFISSYFSFCFPLYVLWRLWVLLFRALRRNQAAETFSLALRKNGGGIPVQSSI